MVQKKKSLFILLVIFTSFLLVVALFVHFQSRSPLQEGAVATLEEANFKGLPSVFFHGDDINLEKDQRLTLNFIQSAYLIQFSGKAYVRFIKSKPKKENSTLLLFMESFQKIKILRRGKPQKIEFSFQ